MTITEFLTARLNERERALRRLVESISRVAGAAFAVEGGTVEWSAEHELADIAAKRAIVAECTEADAYYRTHVDAPAGELAGLRTAVRLLAQPHSDHPDFDPSWRATR